MILSLYIAYEHQTNQWDLRSEELNSWLFSSVMSYQCKQLEPSVHLVYCVCICSHLCIVYAFMLTPVYCVCICSHSRLCIVYAYYAQICVCIDAHTCVLKCFLCMSSNVLSCNYFCQHLVCDLCVQTSFV